ncbi:MAG: hypothetical protein IPM24_19615 [Bryobacterales bacterium]|nr:hypothetical protein [Bryobacterales bacterium]
MPAVADSPVASLPQGKQTQAPPARYLALDAYRGFIMITLCASGFGFPKLKDHPSFAWIVAQFEHVPWEGAVFWDLIQPAFMFMVGVAMPFALARRMSEGAAFSELFRHVGIRAVKLIVLSQILISISGNALQFQLINVLSQIAFTYFFAFLIMQLPFQRQAIAAGAILAGYWALFALFPGSEGAFSRTDNIGAVIDRWWLGRNYSGHYVTINFVTSTVTTLFGVWTGMLLRTDRTLEAKIRILAIAMAAAFASGLLLSLWNPLVKRLWTPSFTLYSTGWVLLMLLVFVWMAEVRGWRRPMFPLVVVGMNSIFIYSLSMLLKGWIDRSLAVFTFRFEFLGTIAPVAQACAVLAVMWWACYWLYQRKIFFKL